MRKKIINTQAKKLKSCTPKKALEKLKTIKQDFIKKASAIETERDRKLARLATKIDKRKIKQIEASLKQK